MEIFWICAAFALVFFAICAGFALVAWSGK